MNNFKTNYKFEKLLDHDRPMLTLNGVPLVDANGYLRVIETRGLSSQTIRAYGYDLLYLYRWLEEISKTFAKINKADLIEYIQYQKLREAKPRSINRRLITCESFHWYCYDKPIASSIGVNYPAPYYKGPGKVGALGLFNLSKPSKLKLSVKVPQTLIETLTPVEVNDFLKDVTRYRDISIVLMMLMCGLRSCEVLSFRKDGIDLTNLQIRVQGKGSKERVVPISKNVIDVIQKYFLFERPEDCTHQLCFVVLQGQRRGLPMTSSGLRSLFRYRQMKSGVEKARPHRWRHSFGTEMARAGVSHQVLQKMMGHADGSPITDQYIHLSMADISNEYEKAMLRIRKSYDI
jgi:site-specific recombinase XerD